MKLHETIQITANRIASPPPFTTDQEIQAEKIGLEAMLREDRHRAMAFPMEPCWLPGEDHP